MITSTANNKVKYIIQLQNKAKVRKENKEFVAEGLKMVQEAPKERIVQIYMSESFEKTNREFVKNLVTPYETVNDNIFAHMTDTQTPQGVLAIVKMMSYDIKDLITDNALIVLAENLQDPGNLGTIIRTGEGAGITGVLLSPNTVDIYNPKTIRSTMGSVFRVPFLYENNFFDAVRELKRNKITIFAAHPEGAGSYADENYTGPSAFLIGNEGNGLSEKAIQQADHLISIPMCGKVESLNAASAAAVLLYEVKRQRDRNKIS